MLYNARVIDRQADIETELYRVCADQARADQVLAEAEHRAVKLHNLSRSGMRAVQSAIEAGGGSAVACGPAGEVLISGSRRQFQRALRELSAHCDECAAIAGEIGAALAGFDFAPHMPDSASLDPRLARVFELVGVRTLVMGILNVTPDSFSDGGRFLDRSAAIAHAAKMADGGADIIDVGGESTRPGAEPVSAGEEIERIAPVIEELSRLTEVAISVDTYKAEVAEAALESGASIVNDISAASFDPQMPSLIAEKRCPAILMHIKGTPRDMQSDPMYEDLMAEVSGFLRERIQALVDAGVDERMLMVDPGIGFGKRVEHNLELLRRMGEFRSIGRPIVVGTSRKSTIGRVLGGLPVEERLEGTAATVAISIANGAHVVRVHDVKEMVRVARMTDAVIRSSPPSAAQ